MTKQARVGRSKSAAKGALILDAAGGLFLASGFQGTSMDAVAQAAGVSKQTVYSHFGNKDELFKACIRAKVSAYGFAEAQRLPDVAPDFLLRAVLRRFLALLFDPQVVAMHRVVMSEAASHPRIAALFYESGPVRTRVTVRELLRGEVARGRLRIAGERLEYAATQLLNMALGDYQTRLLLGVLDAVPEADLDGHLGRVVDDFLRLYGVNPGGA